jgi:putative oxidoreductase
MDNFEPYVTFLGRLLLSSIFLISGFTKIAKPSGDAGQMRSKGMPAVGFFLVMAILVEVGGGLSILLGYKARLGALALFLYLIPVTCIFHNYWTYQDQERLVQMENFMKNLTIMGGLLLVAALGSGSLSVAP